MRSSRFHLKIPEACYRVETRFARRVRRNILRRERRKREGERERRYVEVGEKWRKPGNGESPGLWPVLGRQRGRLSLSLSPPSPPPIFAFRARSRPRVATPGKLSFNFPRNSNKVARPSRVLGTRGYSALCTSPGNILNSHFTGL